MSWNSPRADRPFPGISTVPWVFSPNSQELRKQVQALKRAGVMAIRFNYVTHRTWFRSDTHNALEHLKKVVGELLSQRVMVLITLCTWNENTGGLIGSDDPGEITSGMFLPFQRDPVGGEKSILAVIGAWLADIQAITEALAAYSQNPYLGYEIWNGGEGWQETRHPWTVTNPNGKALLESWEMNFRRLLSGITNPVLGEVPTMMGHWYLGIDGNLQTPVPEHFYKGRRPFTIKTNASPPQWVTELGVYRPDPDWDSAPPSWWSRLISLLPRRYSSIVHSFFDGRFRELTYDQGSTMALWNVSDYIALVNSSGKGVPLVDGWIVEGQQYSYRIVFKLLGIDPFYLNIT